MDYTLKGISKNFNEVVGYLSSPPQKMCETKLVLISVFKSNAKTNEQTIKVKCRVIKNEFKDVKNAESMGKECLYMLRKTITVGELSYLGISTYEYTSPVIYARNYHEKIVR